MPPRHPEMPLSPSDGLSQTATAPMLLERQLRSGRSLTLRAGSDGEEIEIRSSRGELDLRITLTDDGPLVSLRGGRLELESSSVAVRCNTFEVEAKEQIRLASQGQLQLTADELRASTERDIHLNGAFIRLNCTDDGLPSGSASDSGNASDRPSPAAAASCCECDHATAPQR